MKTIKDSMASSNAKFNDVSQEHQTPSLPPSLLSISDTNSTKGLLLLVERYRDDLFPIELIWGSDSPSRCVYISSYPISYKNVHKDIRSVPMNIEEQPSITDLVRQKRQSRDLYVFAHGYRGTYCDLRLMSNCLMQYAIVHGTMQKQWFPKQPHVLLSRSYQEHTQSSILELGIKLAEEIRITSRPGRLT